MFRWALCVVLVAAYLGGPFTHVHAGGEAKQHVAETHAGSLAFHLHLAAGGDERAAWQADPAESARLLNLFKALERDLFQGAALSASEFELEPPRAQARCGVVETVRQRSRAAPGPRSPRAPPA